MNPDEIKTIPEEKTLYGQMVSGIRNQTRAEVFLALNKVMGEEMSQNRFCWMIGIDPSYFSRILSGIRAGRHTQETT